MVGYSNHLGDINISKSFFYALIGGTVSKCYGVADTNAGNFKQTVFESLPFLKRFAKRREKGVAIHFSGGKLYIDLFITVTYGVNVPSIVKSIRHKVRYAVEQETDLTVERVNIYVLGLKS